MARSKASNTTKVLLGIIGLLTVVIVLLSYKLYSQNSSPTSQTYSLQSATYEPTSDMLSLNSDNQRLFKHTNLSYSVNIPNGWTPRIYRTLAGAAVQPYEDVIFLSPDYEQTPSNVSTPIIDKGASIFIRGVETQYSNSRERFESIPVAKRIAQNVTDITVAGVPALQYDYSLNGENVTNVTVVKNGFWYLIKYQYADDDAKTQYLNAFQDVVNSFKPSK